MTAFVDPVTRLGTLLGPAASGNGGQFFYMAVQPGVTGGSQPTWPQVVLREVPDGGVIWFTVAQSTFLSASGGVGGATGGFNTLSMEIPPSGVVATSTVSGCRTEYISNGTLGETGSFNITNGFGHSGSGGSNFWGTGGVAIAIVDVDRQATGSSGVTSSAGFGGAGGGGAVSANNGAGANKNGGAAQAGGVLVRSWAGAIP